MYNKIVLVGHLTRAPEIRYTPGGTSIANTGIATNRKYKSQIGENKEEVMFVDLTFFGRTAEIANQYLRKGSKVLVEGRLVLDQWTDKTGAKRSRHTVTVDNLQMLDSVAERDNLDKMTHTNISEQTSTYKDSVKKSDEIKEIDLSIDEDTEIPF